MASYCKVTIIGNVGRDPELKTVSADRKVAEFSVAVGSKNGAEERTDWFKISAWDKQADTVMNYVKKGDQIFVEGQLRIREYIDRDQKNRTSFEIVSPNFQLLGNKPQENGSSDAQPYRGASANTSEQPANNQQQPKAVAPAAANKGTSDLDDLPF